MRRLRDVDERAAAPREALVAYSAYALAYLDQRLFPWPTSTRPSPATSALVMHARGGLGPSTLTMGEPPSCGQLLSLHPGPRQAFVTCEADHVETVLTAHNVWRPQTMLRMQLDETLHTRRAEHRRSAPPDRGRRHRAQPPLQRGEARATPAARSSKASTSAPSTAAGWSPPPAPTSTRSEKVSPSSATCSPTRTSEPRPRHRRHRRRGSAPPGRLRPHRAQRRPGQPHRPSHLRADRLPARPAASSRRWRRAATPIRPCPCCAARRRTRTAPNTEPVACRSAGHQPSQVCPVPLKRRHSYRPC